MAAELRFFPPFRLDSNNEQLWRGNKQVRLRRKTFAVLRHLAERPGELVTKAALLDAIWPDVSVSDSMPAHSVRELRKALGDAAQTPRFIETVQGRGYRFIAKVKLEPGHVPTTPAARQSLFAMQPQQTSFVGREQEKSELRRALAAAASGRGRICLISGEAGIGKTRLCAEISLDAEKKGVAVLVGHCSEQEAIPYLPFVEILESWVDRRQSPDDLRRAMGEEGPELGRLLPKLRRIIPDLPPPLELSPMQARRNLFNCFCDFAARIATEQPTLLVLEDLHWAEDSTLSLLGHLTQRLSDLPILVLGTYRDAESEVTHALAKTLEESIRSRHDSSIRLAELPREEVAELLKALSGKDAPVSVVNEIYRETAGNPFFVEELLRHLSEENRLYDSHGDFRTDLEISELDVPRSVRLVVGRRLARLDTMTRTILETAATIGKSFPFDLLAAATVSEPNPLLDCLDQAEHAALVASSESEARFEFRHELIRQVVISGLSAARRQRLHVEVANAIERIYSDRPEGHSVELAHHYSLAGNLSKAVEYLERAALGAAQQMAHSEAAAFASSAIEKLRSLPEGEPRDRLELRLQQSMIFYLMVTKGYGAVEVAAPLQRTRELAAKLNAGPEYFGATEMARSFHCERGELAQSRKLAGEISAMAERSGKPLALAVAALALGQEAIMAGEFVTARRNFERARELFPDHEKKQPAAAHLYWWSTSFLCLTLCMLGYMRQAQQISAAAMHEAKTLGEQLGVAVTTMFYGWVHLLAGDFHRALEHLEIALSIAADHGLLHITHTTVELRAEVLLNLGRVEEGIAEIRRLRADLHQEETLSLQLNSSMGLAWACGLGNQTEESLRNLARALELIEATGQRSGEAKVHILWGRILLMGGDKQADEAERHLRIAIAVACRQEAKFFELRATLTLARLLERQHKRKEARAMLADIYGWFTEGFDTADLKDAKALLDRLDSES